MREDLLHIPIDHVAIETTPVSGNTYTYQRAYHDLDIDKSLTDGAFIYTITQNDPGADYGAGYVEMTEAQWNILVMHIKANY